MTIVLASQSPRRKELLALIEPEFLVAPADIDETPFKGESPEVYVTRMAKEKAAVICRNYFDDIVIACDTIVVFQNEIFGKPVSREEAKGMLEKFSGQTHQVMTAVAICCRGRWLQETFRAEVTFYDLKENEIEQYLLRDEYSDKAGAYGIQGGAAIFVKEIVGDYYSIVGFPVAGINQLLRHYDEFR